MFRRLLPLLPLVLWVGAPWLHTAGAAESQRTPLRLTLDKAIRMALQQNFSLEAERISPKISKQGVRIAVAEFVG
jgi:hypothetical protein